jgi:FixJ family two-component response regulator
LQSITGHGLRWLAPRIVFSAAAFLQKPFEPSTLLDTVRRVIEAKSE